MKKIIFSILVFTAFLNPVHAQNTDLKEIFLAAESYFLFEEYNEALPLYLRVHRHYPDNDNINYKIGICFLNNPYEKNKSILYLEEAVENIDPKYKENSFKETSAPLESLFFLANAYRVNNQLNKAREYYKIFLSRIDKEIYDEELVNEQLAACDAAEALMKKPIDFDITNLSEKINTRFADTNPVVSGDETKIAFISKLQFYDAVFYAEKINGEWAPPRNIIPELGVDGDVYPTALSYNGTEMFVYRNDDYIGNIYYTQLVNNKWTPLQKLGENINTKYWESHASLSKDGKTLYFSSNRKGGFGGLDIYKSKRQTNGHWGPASNLGSVINTKYNDDTPFITENEEKIYFSSYGHYSMGGYDIFMAKNISDTTWANPVNMGYPINSTDDNQFFLPLKNGAIAYYSQYTQEGYGRHDIFRYEIYSPDNPRLFDISGLIDFMEESDNKEQVSIKVVNKQNKDTLINTNPDENGNFSFKVPTGNYSMIFDGNKFKQKIIALEVSQNTPHEGIILDFPVVLELLPPVIPPKDISDYLTIKEDSIIHVKAGKDVKIKYLAKPGTISEINVINDENAVYSDSLLIDKKRQSFEFKPLPGKNTVSISLKDKEGNTVSKSVVVIYTDESKERDTEDNNLVPALDSLGNIQKKNSENAQTITEAELLLRNLLNNSEGNLNKFLNNTDTKALNLNTKQDLIDYLNQNAESQNYDREDLLSALQKSGELSESDILIKEITEIASPELQNFLKNIDTKDTSFASMEELFNYLYENADSENYTTEEVDQLVQKYQNSKNLEKLRNELISISDGPLKDYLENLNFNKEGIDNYEDLIKHLLENEENNPYSTQNVIDLVNRYAADQKTEAANSLLSNLQQNEALKAILDTQDNENLEFSSEQDVYKYFFKNNKDLSLEDLIRNLLKSSNPNLDLLKAGLKISDKELMSEILKNTPDSIGTSLQLFDYLLQKAEKTGDFEKSDVTKSFKEYLENKDLYDFLSLLKMNSDTDLLNFLNSINLEKENIRNRDELINYLINQSDNSKFTKADLMKAVAATDNGIFNSHLIDMLIKNANPQIRKALLDLKSNNIEIKSIEDLLSYLIKNKDQYDYSVQDILDLFKQYFDGDLSSLIPATENKEENIGNTNKHFKAGLAKTLIILGIEGLIILILIIFVRRKKKKNQQEQ